MQQTTELPTAEDVSYDLFTLQDNTHDPITMQLEINQVLLTMEVDTGAPLTLINKAAYNLISQSGQPTELKELI